MEKKVFKYATRDAQVARVNKVMCFTFGIFYLVSFIIVAVCVIQGLRKASFAIGLYVIMLGSLVAIITTYRKKPSSEKLRWYALVALGLVSLMMCIEFNSYYMRFACVGPVVGFILFYDKKFSLIASLAMDAIEFGTYLIRVVTNSYTKNEVVDIGTAALVSVVVITLCWYLEKVLEQFSDDMLGDIEQRAKETEQIMQEVLYVADEVQKGATKAMNNMNNLDESTSSVSEAMDHISASTQMNADDIQEQTEMTQNIQDLIEQTLAQSQEMTAIATESIEINGANITIMNNLKLQAEAIKEVNEGVSTSMEALSKTSEEVKGITDVIFEISSRTNLLALNASIEAARAGEAGKGFAVVADEIRNLADQTKQSTEDITRLITELGNNAQDASSAVTNAGDAASKQGELIEKASASFVKMNENVGLLTKDIEDVGRMVENLANSNNAIVENISHLSATTEEVTAASAQASELSTQNAELSNKTKEVLENVMKVSRQFDKYAVETE